VCHAPHGDATTADFPTADYEVIHYATKLPVLRTPCGVLGPAASNPGFVTCPACKEWLAKRRTPVQRDRAGGPGGSITEPPAGVRIDRFYQGDILRRHREPGLGGFEPAPPPRGSTRPTQVAALHAGPLAHGVASSTVASTAAWAACPRFTNSMSQHEAHVPRASPPTTDAPRATRRGARASGTPARHRGDGAPSGRGAQGAEALEPSLSRHVGQIQDDERAVVLPRDHPHVVVLGLPRRTHRAPPVELVGF
jgi:hypothetical protein